MKTFIRATEVWVPGPDGSMLELAAGAYGEAVRFAALSQGVRFAYGEGLPGKCWQEGRPIILRKFENSYFQRTDAAHSDGLTCGIALPIFAGDFLTAVLVIFCGDDAEHAGAIELWHNAPPSVEMLLADGYYGSTGDTFETVARQVSLRRGSGLPGLSWQRGGPVFMADLGRGSAFLRADTAQRVGINRGFAFPCSGRGNDTWIMGPSCRPWARLWSVVSRSGSLIKIARQVCRVCCAPAASVSRPACLSTHRPATGSTPDRAASAG